MPWVEYSPSSAVMVSLVVNEALRRVTITDVNGCTASAHR